MACFYCGKNVSVIRKLSDPDFCCEEHRKKYHELTKLALNRLLEAQAQMAPPAPRKRRSTWFEIEDPPEAAPLGLDQPAVAACDVQPAEPAVVPWAVGLEQPSLAEELHIAALPPLGMKTPAPAATPAGPAPPRAWLWVQARARPAVDPLRALALRAARTPRLAVCRLAATAPAPRSMPGQPAPARALEFAPPDPRTPSNGHPSSTEPRLATPGPAHDGGFGRAGIEDAPRAEDSVPLRAPPVARPAAEGQRERLSPRTAPSLPFRSLAAARPAPVCHSEGAAAFAGPAATLPSRRPHHPVRTPRVAFFMTADPPAPAGAPARARAEFGAPNGLESRRTFPATSFQAVRTPLAAGWVASPDVPRVDLPAIPAVLRIDRSVPAPSPPALTQPGGTFGLPPAQLAGFGAPPPADPVAAVRSLGWELAPVATARVVLTAEKAPTLRGAGSPVALAMPGITAEAAAPRIEPAARMSRPAPARPRTPVAPGSHPPLKAPPISLELPRAAAASRASLEPPSLTRSFEVRLPAADGRASPVRLALAPESRLAAQGPSDRDGRPSSAGWASVAAALALTGSGLAPILEKIEVEPDTAAEVPLPAPAAAVLRPAVMAAPVAAFAPQAPQIRAHAPREGPGGLALCSFAPLRTPTGASQPATPASGLGWAQLLCRLVPIPPLSEIQAAALATTSAAGIAAPQPRLAGGQPRITLAPALAEPAICWPAVGPRPASASPEFAPLQPGATPSASPGAAAVAVAPMPIWVPIRAPGQKRPPQRPELAIASGATMSVQAAATSAVPSLAGWIAPPSRPIWAEAELWVGQGRLTPSGALPPPSPQTVPSIAVPAPATWTELPGQPALAEARLPLTGRLAPGIAGETSGTLPPPLQTAISSAAPAPATWTELPGQPAVAEAKLTLAGRLAPSVAAETPGTPPPPQTAISIAAPAPATWTESPGRPALATANLWVAPGRLGPEFASATPFLPPPPRTGELQAQAAQAEFPAAALKPGREIGAWDVRVKPAGYGALPAPLAADSKADPVPAGAGFVAPGAAIPALDFERAAARLKDSEAIAGQAEAPVLLGKARIEPWAGTLLDPVRRLEPAHARRTALAFTAEARAEARPEPLVSAAATPAPATLAGFAHAVSWPAPLARREGRPRLRLLGCAPAATAPPCEPAAAPQPPCAEPFLAGRPRLGAPPAAGFNFRVRPPAGALRTTPAVVRKLPVALSAAGPEEFRICKVLALMVVTQDRPEAYPTEFGLARSRMPGLTALPLRTEAAAPILRSNPAQRPSLAGVLAEPRIWAQPALPVAAPGVIRSEPVPQRASVAYRARPPVPVGHAVTAAAFGISRTAPLHLEASTRSDQPAGLRLAASLPAKAGVALPRLAAGLSPAAVGPPRLAPQATVRGPADDANAARIAAGFGAPVPQPVPASARFQTSAIRMFPKKPLRPMVLHPRDFTTPAHTLPLGEPHHQVPMRLSGKAVAIAGFDFASVPKPPYDPPWAPLVRAWRAAPGLIRSGFPIAAIAAMLLLIVWAVAGDSIGAKLQQRAAIVISDDFRSGFGAWRGPRGWSSSWKQDPAGFVRIGQLALLRSSRGLADYKLELLGQIPAKGLGWVYRAKDLDNFYAMRLMIAQPGPLPAAVLVRSVVVRGNEVQRIQVPVRKVVQTDKAYAIRFEARGDGFTTFIDGEVVDFWRDGRFRTGGVGLFGEIDDPARIYRIRLSHRDDFLGKICGYLAPDMREGTNGGLN